MLFQPVPVQVWVATFASSGEMILSGGDDSSLRGWDPRQGFSQPIFADTRTHEAGVCSLAADPSDAHYFLSGSYDTRSAIRRRDTLSLILVALTYFVLPMQSTPLGLEAATTTRFPVRDRRWSMAAHLASFAGKRDSCCLYARGCINTTSD